MTLSGAGPFRRLRVVREHLQVVPCSSNVYAGTDGTLVDFSAFVGKIVSTTTCVASLEPLQTLACIFDRPGSDLGLIQSGHVPRGWVYDIGGGVFIRDHSTEASLLPDGKPGGGGRDVGGGATLPSAFAKLGLTRMMFAGVRFVFHGDISVGDMLRVEVSIESVRIAKSSTGPMAIYVTATRVYVGDRLVLEQLKNSVMKSGVESGQKDVGTKARPKPPLDTVWKREITPTPVSLFSYSAVTFNRHRIHYDTRWAEDVEGYPGLVVHGPFVMQLLVDFVRDMQPGKTIEEFEMKAMQPLFVNNPIRLVGKPPAGGSRVCEMWAVAPDGSIAQTFKATLA